MINVRENILNQILAHRDRRGLIILYPHVGADGDALGSSLALLQVLRTLGCEACLLVDEPVPPKLAFLPLSNQAEVFDESLTREWIDRQTLALAIDCADADRTGRRRSVFDEGAVKAALDHHVSSGESAELRLIDAGAAATGEIITDLIVDLERATGLQLITREVAFLLMVAIISDTGGFVYSNTSERTFATASLLMKQEPDLRQITYQIFDRTSQTRIRLTGRIFTDARFSHHGRIALAMADQVLLDTYGAEEYDLDGLVSELRNVAGVEVSLMLRQLTDGAVRVNIRSSDRFDAASFARQFGGGGHPKAAGMTIKGLSLAEVSVMILAKVADRLPGGDHE